MDIGSREHWLLLLGALLVYGTLGMGLLALGAHMNYAVARTLRDLSQG